MTNITESSRAELIRAFEAQKFDLVEEKISLLHLAKNCHEPGGDEADAADEHMTRQDACRRVAVLNEDIARATWVITELKGGWDATCIECGESVLARLERGHPTRRCVKCKEAMEAKFSGRRTLRPSFAT